MSEIFLFEKAEGVATLTLNRPDKLNAFTPELHADLKAGLDEVERDAAIRAVLLTGAGRGFCAGQDLSLRRGASGNTSAASLDTWYNPLVRRLRRLEKPVVCAVNGVAAGAGANIALACDIVLAARSASFIQAFCKIGLVPDAGGSYVLPRLVGMARAGALMLLGDKLSAEQAAQWGLIWRVVDDAELMGEATSLARHLARQPTRALGAHQAGAQCELRQHARPAARPRARSPDGRRRHRGFPRGRRGLPRQAGAEVFRALTPPEPLAG